MSRAFPCGTPWTISTSTTSASSLSAIRCAAVAPTLPAPSTVTFRLAMNFSPLFCGFFGSGGSAWAQIRVFVKCFAVLVEKLNSHLGANESFLDLLLYELFHSPLQVVREILNDREDFLNG